MESRRGKRPIADDPDKGQQVQLREKRGKHLDQLQKQRQQKHGKRSARVKRGGGKSAFPCRLQYHLHPMAAVLNKNDERFQKLVKQGIISKKLPVLCMNLPADDGIIEADLFIENALKVCDTMEESLERCRAIVAAISPRQQEIYGTVFTANAPELKMHISNRNDLRIPSGVECRMSRMRVVIENEQAQELKNAIIEKRTADEMPREEGWLYLFIREIDQPHKKGTLSSAVYKGWGRLRFGKCKAPAWNECRADIINYPNPSVS